MSGQSSLSRILALFPAENHVGSLRRGMLHDEEKYPDAFKFMPERFADPQKNAKSRINEPPHIAFGFGRRCVVARAVWSAQSD